MDIVTAPGPADSRVGEIRLFAHDHAPDHWLPCDGQLVGTLEYKSLFEVIGYMYGGSGDLFRVPDLRGHTPVGVGTDGDVTYSLGQSGGSETVSLPLNAMPAHTHTMKASADRNVSNSPSGRLFGTSEVPPQSPPPPMYRTAAAAMVVLDSTAISIHQGGPHNNMQPFLTLRCCIATYGSGD